jgi:hypothetical protein
MAEHQEERARGSVEHPRLVLFGQDYGGVRRLPVVEIEGKYYYRDDRLREYRNLDDLADRIPFPDEQ